MKKKEIKEKIQEMLMHQVANVSYVIGDLDLDPEQEKIYFDEAKKQMDRIAKMFGYEQSWFN